MFNQEFINANTNLVIKKYVELFEKKSQDFELSSLVVNEIMKSCLKNSNEDIRTYDVLKCRYDYVISYAKEKVINLISEYDVISLKIIFYNLAEYMAESHIHIYEKIYSIYGNKYWQYQISDKDLMRNQLIDKINIENMDRFSTLMGMDNVFIQYLFIFIDEIDQLKIKNVNSRIIISEAFFEIYDLVVGIASLIEERDYFQFHFEQLKIVKVENGIIIMPEPVKEKFKAHRKNSIISAVKTDHSFSNKQYEKMLWKFSQDYGFTTSDLMLLFNEFIKNPEISNNLITIMPKNELQFYIDKLLSEPKGEHIIKYLLLRSNKKSDTMISISQYNDRLFKRPLIQLVLECQSFIMFSPFLFYYTISSLTKDIRYACTKSINQNALKKINNEIVEKLEIELVSCGLQHYSNHYIENKDSGLNYEVDILFIKNNCLYIAECKDISPKFTVSELKNDLRRIKKEYIPNLNLKYNIILNDIEGFKSKIGGNFITIKKILVFKNYSFAKEAVMDVLTESKIELFTETELVELIGK